jgi:hypothetical protein
VEVELEVQVHKDPQELLLVLEEMEKIYQLQ